MGSSWMACLPTCAQLYCFSLSFVFISKLWPIEVNVIYNDDWYLYVPPVDLIKHKKMRQVRRSLTHLFYSIKLHDDFSSLKSAKMSYFTLSMKLCRNSEVLHCEVNNFFTNLAHNLTHLVESLLKNLVTFKQLIDANYKCSSVVTGFLVKLSTFLTHVKALWYRQQCFGHAFELCLSAVHWENHSKRPCRKNEALLFSKCPLVKRP